MTTPPNEDNLADELIQLGQNLKDALRSAWQSEEGQKVRQEIGSGLAALEAGLKDAANELSAGETGQRLKSEVQDLGERVRSGQVEARVRADLLEALRTVNAELQKFSRGQERKD